MGVSNLCIFVGRVGRDPDMSFTERGLAVTKFSMAIDNGKDKQGNKLTIWINFKAFDKLAETINTYVRSGDQLAVQCRYSPTQYTDKATGTAKTWHEFIADSITFGAKSSKSRQQDSETKEVDWHNIEPDGTGAF